MSLARPVNPTLVKCAWPAHGTISETVRVVPAVCRDFGSEIKATLLNFSLAFCCPSCPGLLGRGAGVLSDSWGFISAVGEAMAVGGGKHSRLLGGSKAVYKRLFIQGAELNGAGWKVSLTCCVEYEWEGGRRVLRVFWLRHGA